MISNEGGTFALYSLLCRYAKIGLIPSQQVEDQEVSNFQVDLPSGRLKMASCLKSKLENSTAAKIFLLFATMLGTSMVIGDGVLTPSISGNFFFSFFQLYRPWFSLFTNYSSFFFLYLRFSPLSYMRGWIEILISRLVS